MKLWSSLRHQEAIRRAPRSSRRGPKSGSIDTVNVLKPRKGDHTVMLSVEPGPGGPTDTLAHALLWIFIYW